MDDIRIIEVKQSVFADNNADAERLRRQLKEEKTFLLNLMSSPGSGKTSLLKKVSAELSGKLRLAVMEAAVGIFCIIHKTPSVLGCTEPAMGTADNF